MKEPWLQYIEIPLKKSDRRSALKPSIVLRQWLALGRKGKRAGLVRRRRILIHSEKSDEKNRRFVL